MPPRRPPAHDPRTAGVVDAAVMPVMQQVMSKYAGGLRDAAGLERGRLELARLAEQQGTEPGLESWEATNLVTVATAVVASARLREESRGAHWRDDFEGRREAWQGHLIAERDGAGSIRHHFVPSAEVAK